VHTLDIAPLRSESPPQKRSGMYGTCSQGISWFYLYTHTFIRNRNEPYLPLPSQPQLVLIYRPRRDGRLSRPWPLPWFRHLNMVTDHPCHGLPFAKFQLDKPFHSRHRVRNGSGRRTDKRRPSTLNAFTLFGRGIINLEQRTFLEHVRYQPTVKC